MKKIINGKRYDTASAIEIGHYSSSYGGTDHQYWEATLYRTKRSGQYFMAGEGGPMSRFAQSNGQNSWSGGEDLIPMSKDEALEFAEQYLDSDEIEDHFADVIEDA